jgi:predicted regulator of Ras-like GTPase activity (Roadblock/LC7/MglB family)
LLKLKCTDSSLNQHLQWRVEQGFSILTSCGQDAVFLVLAGKAAKEGVLILEIKRALTELKPALL